MHDYLRAVGFSKVTHRRDLKQILDMVIAQPQQEYIACDAGKTPYAEKSRDFLPNAGLTVRGEVDERGIFNFEYFFPHYNGSHFASTEVINFEKISEREEYDGVCDPVNLGVSMIFHMNRLVDYAENVAAQGFLEAGIRVSALSISGTVLIPIARSEEQKNRLRKETENRNGMIAAARQGDQEALENLTIDDIDLYTEISRRVKHEDILSIVESSFMPYGIACDHYAILGDIVECQEAYNQLTGEKVYQLTVECNDLPIDVCINAEDLLGEPQPGRRFRGTIWLQGNLEEII